MPVYDIGSLVFESIKVHLSNGKTFEVEARNCSEGNRYIQSATLNSTDWEKPWFTHEKLVNGGKLVLVMGDKANKSWGGAEKDAPPSAEGID